MFLFNQLFLKKQCLSILDRVVSNYSHTYLYKKKYSDSNILVSPKAGRGNRFPMNSTSFAFLRVRRINREYHERIQWNTKNTINFIWYSIHYNRDRHVLNSEYKLKCVYRFSCQTIDKLWPNISRKYFWLRVINKLDGAPVLCTRL